MLHTFEALGRYIAMDADSGAVHLLDEMAFDALNAIQAGDVAPLYQKYDENDVRELLEEIDALKAQGALFAEHDYSHLEIEKSGIVKAMCLHAAHDCNLRCKYCFASTGDFMGRAACCPWKRASARWTGWWPIPVTAKIWKSISLAANR